MGNGDGFDPKTAVYTPLQASTYTLDMLRGLKDTAGGLSGIDIPIPEMQAYFPRVLAGQVCAIIAQTSNYKSGFMHFVERSAALHLSAIGASDHILIHVSVEESIEEQMLIEYARETGQDAGEMARGAFQDWKKLEAVSFKVGEIPIYRIGDSLARSDDAPVLYISNMVRAIDALVNGDVLDWKPKVAGIFFDYLQAFPIDPEWKSATKDQQRRLQVRSDMYRLRQCSKKYMCPVFVAVQAKQNLDGASPPIMLPGQYDGEESAAIAQRCDRILTLWMPKQTHSIGSTINARSGDFVVEEDQLWIKVAKQRGRLPSGKTWRCVVDFQNNVVSVQKKAGD